MGKPVVSLDMGSLMSENGSKFRGIPILLRTWQKNSRPEASGLRPVPRLASIRTRQDPTWGWA